MNADFWIAQMKAQCGTVATIRSKMNVDFWITRMNYLRNRRNQRDKKSEPQMKICEIRVIKKSEPQRNANFRMAQLKICEISVISVICGSDIRSLACPPPPNPT